MCQICKPLHEGTSIWSGKIIGRIGTGINEWQSRTDLHDFAIQKSGRGQPLFLRLPKLPITSSYTRHQPRTFILRLILRRSSCSEMKRVYSAWIALLLAVGCAPPSSVPQGVQVYFSPHGGATEAVVNALEHATNSVLVQAYSFTSAPIAKAIVEANRRGVRVHVILDGSQRSEKYSEADFLQNSEIPTLIDAQHAIAHNKIIIVDDYLILTGSFNFTKAAEERNAENLLVINDPSLAKRYLENWRAHEAHSQPYAREVRSDERPKREKRAKISQ
jgi:phosphatidylserine/phosphatidylglycerophosphate/cardiolipin synthase-like enzyme